ncbi:hypothetical protein Cgig2_006425 [Carnegiea gigantea]|uniref:Uncharacterized protein n=1 Tax=Carnegiea gigantea TaxID=171969 RepID=A0A9Q1JJF1_9CARY|nr:hypothetical protein Cgig2_006425 [Carnegiea gigantea]
MRNLNCTLGFRLESRGRAVKRESSDREPERDAERARLVDQIDDRRSAVPELGARDRGFLATAAGLRELVFYVVWNLNFTLSCSYWAHHIVERVEAANLFASKEAEEDVKKSALKTFASAEVLVSEEVPKEEAVSKVVPPTPEQIIAIKAAIVNSQTLEEVARLEKALKSGELPANLKIPDDGAIRNRADADGDKMATDVQDEMNMVSEDAEGPSNSDVPTPMEQV